MGRLKILTQLLPSGTHGNVGFWPVVQDGADVSSVLDGYEQSSGGTNETVDNQHLSTSRDLGAAGDERLLWSSEDVAVVRARQAYSRSVDNGHQFLDVVH